MWRVLVCLLATATLAVSLASLAHAQPITPGGLRQVTTDTSLDGAGTVASPLGLRSDCGSSETLAWDGDSWECTAAGSGITNSAGNNVLMKSDGTNAVASTITDNGAGAVIQAQVADVAAYTVGDSVASTGATDNGYEISSYLDGNVYLSAKVGDGDAIFHRVGHNTENGAARIWLTVTGSTGAAAFGSGGISVTGNLSTNGNLTAGDATTDSHTINGEATFIDAVGGSFSVAVDNNIQVRDSTSAALGVGGGIEFQGNYTGTTSTAAALIKATKTNGTDGNYSFDLAFGTRPNGGGDVIEAMRIYDTGLVATHHNTQLGSDSSDTVYAPGYMGIGTAADASYDLKVADNVWLNSDGGTTTVDDLTAPGQVLISGTGTDGLYVNNVSSQIGASLYLTTGNHNGNQTIFLDSEVMIGGSTHGDQNLTVNGNTTFSNGPSGINTYDGTHLEWNEEWVWRAHSTNTPGITFNHFYCAGSGTGVACAVLEGIAGGRPGIQQQSVGTTTTGRVAWMLGANAVDFSIGSWSARWAVGLPTLSTSAQEYSFIVGFWDDPASVNQTDGCYFLYDRGNVASGGDNAGNADKLQCVCASNGTRTVHIMDGSNVSDESFTTVDAPVAAVTWPSTNVLDLEVVMTGTTRAEFYVGGTKACNINTNIPSGSSRTTGMGALMIKSAGTTARTYEHDYTGWSVDLTSAR